MLVQLTSNFEEKKSGSSENTSQNIIKKKELEKNDYQLCEKGIIHTE